MAGSLSITEAELLDALASAVIGDAPEEARTVQELAEMTGVGLARVRKGLKRLAAQRRLTVHQVRRMDISGRLLQVPAYTILSPPT